VTQTHQKINKLGPSTLDFQPPNKPLFFIKNLALGILLQLHKIGKEYGKKHVGINILVDIKKKKNNKPSRK
jgi:hypothetical protein